MILDEAQIFESALRCILLEVDVPILDDVLSVKDCKTGEVRFIIYSLILVAAKYFFSL